MKNTPPSYQISSPVSEGARLLSPLENAVEIAGGIALATLFSTTGADSCENLALGFGIIAGAASGLASARIMSNPNADTSRLARAMNRCAFYAGVAASANAHLDARDHLSSYMSSMIGQTLRAAAGFAAGLVVGYCGSDTVERESL